MYTCKYHSKSALSFLDLLQCMRVRLASIPMYTCTFLYMYVQCIVICTRTYCQGGVAFRNIAKRGHLVKMEIGGGQRLKAVWIVEFSRYTPPPRERLLLLSRERDLDRERERLYWKNVHGQYHYNASPPKCNPVGAEER